MITYDAYLEIWPDGSTLAQVLELPGCYAKGATEEQAIAYLRIAVPDYYRWLSMQDNETPTMSDEVGLTIRERVSVIHNELHEVRAFFTPENQPLADDDLDWGLALMSYTHQDITRQVQSLDQQTFNWKPDVKTQSIQEIISGMVLTEAWLITRLDDQNSSPAIQQLSGTLLEQLDQLHEQNMLRLSESTPEMRAAVKERGGEWWSLKKIIRRSILNEREQGERIAIMLGQYASR
jgi:hypothetical protein